MPSEFEVFDAGSIRQGELVSHTFVVSNSTDEPLVFDLPTTDTECCTSVVIGKDTLQPGEQTGLTVKFNSSQQPGDFVADFTLPIKSPETASRGFRLVAQVSEDILWEPRQLELRPGAVGELRITSRRETPLTVNKVDVALLSMDVEQKRIGLSEMVLSVKLGPTVQASDKPQVGVIEVSLDDPLVKLIPVAVLVPPR